MANASVPRDIRSALKSLFSEVNLLSTRLRFAPTVLDNHASLAAGDISVLRALADCGPQTVPQIARLRGTSRQNIQILVNRLIEDGCVTLGENPAHKRSGLVHLTSRGKALFEEAVGKETGFMTAIASEVSEAEVIAANSLLREFRNRLEKVETSRNEPSSQASSITKKPVRKSRSKTPTTEFATPREPQPVDAPAGESETDADAAGDLPYNLL